MQSSVDIIVPSFRLDEQFILPILHMQRPGDRQIKCFLIADDPHVVVNNAILDLIDNQNNYLILNAKNLGAAASRNIGIEQSEGDWIIFLDDDIKVPPDLLLTYITAIDQFPDEIGFIGLITFPAPSTAFSKAVLANGSAAIFSIALQKKEYAWGATANMAIKRFTMGSTRFSLAYPKQGGGEDIDFFLRVRQANNFKDYRTLSQAEVWHPWWQNGKADLKRAFRYGMGTGILKVELPAYTRLDFLSTPETLILLIFVLFLTVIFQNSWTLITLISILGLLFSEIIAGIVFILFRKGNFSAAVVWYVILLKWWYDCGTLWINISRRRFSGIGRRFNDDGRLGGVNFFRLNRYKITKMVLYLALAVYIFSRSSS